MEQLATRDLRKLVSVSGSTASPCISVYLPVINAGEDTEQTRKRLNRLLNTVRETLALHYPNAAMSMGRSLLAFADKLPRFVPGRALAIFISQKVSGYIPLSETVNEMAVVSESFHVKPLLSLLQGQERYFVVSLTTKKAQVFEGNSHGMESREIIYRSPPKCDESRDFLRFCHEIERRLKARFRGRQEPLLIVAPEHLRATYRRISRLRNHIDDSSLSINTEISAPAELHAITWPLAVQYLGRQRKRIEREFRIARHKRITLENLEDVARAAADGRIISLFIEKNVQLWGRFDQDAQPIFRREIRNREPVDCMLDDLAEQVIASGGDVYLLSPGEMPTRSPVAAIVKRASKSKNSA